MVRTDTQQHQLPVDPLIPVIMAQLGAGRNLVIVADPGSGKTTRIPPACLGAEWLGRKKILMLEPRRIAARAAATYIARQRHERPGESVGYRVRGDSRVGKDTRLEVVTEGILTRMLQDDPSLENVGLILFDEFHERSVHVDLALALALEVQRAIRPDLRLVVMSATIDAESVSQLLGGATVIDCPGRQFPVEKRYLAQPITRHMDQAVADAVRRALREESGDILVFLPGRGEIQRVSEKLSSGPELSAVSVLPLHSEIRGEMQDRILSPDPEGSRRVILATNIAETSLTIPGVRLVIDSGLMRVPRFNVRRGIAGLETVAVSRASADQRAGRAGRQESGICYRLWTAREQAELAPYNVPEIIHADLTPLLLELAAWGTMDPGAFSFLTNPPEAQVRQARELLILLGAVSAEGRITDHGRRLLGISVHPRLGHLLLKASTIGLADEACTLIALLEEASSLGERDPDQLFSSRYEMLRRHRQGGNSTGRAAFARIEQEIQRLRQLLGLPSSPSQEIDSSAFGKLLALAYPERIAQQREQGGVRFLMRSGTGATVPERSLLVRHRYLAVAELDGSGSNARVFLAEPLQLEEIEELFSDEIVRRRDIYWDSQAQAVRGREVRALGALVLSEVPVSVNDEEALPILAQAFKSLGFDQLPFKEGGSGIRERILWLKSREIEDQELPDLSSGRLMDALEEWLSSLLPGIRKLSDLERVDIDQLLSPYLSYQTRERVNLLAPADITLPSGRVVPIDYSGERAPVISARLQELFGLRNNPSVGRGAVPLTIMLLSPAGRPLQVTADLESFWKNSYTEVRKEMQGRYPKHAWPVDPLSATPLRGTKKRG